MWPLVEIGTRVYGICSRDGTVSSERLRRALEYGGLDAGAERNAAAVHFLPESSVFNEFFSLPTKCC